MLIFWKEIATNQNSGISALQKARNASPKSGLDVLLVII